MIEEKGPWAAAYSNDKAFIESDDFTHDVRLYVSGDFESIEQRIEYAEEIAKRLNTFASRDAEIAFLQSRIDELMLEYCPNEMTREQLDNYAAHQRPVDESELPEAIRARSTK